MAPVQQARHVNGFDPPPSSILATHVVHGIGVPDFDRSSFNQLLEEALGCDEDGQPNLGSDTSICHKLICIILQVGIEPAIREQTENPFRTERAAGKGDLQLVRCLDVVRVAIERAPPVLFVKSDAANEKDAARSATPLYVWLVPKLLPLIAPGQDITIRNAVVSVLAGILKADQQCATVPSCRAILKFISTMVSVLLAHVTARDSLAIDGDILFDDDFLNDGMSQHGIDIARSIPGLRFLNLLHVLDMLSQVMSVLQSYSDSPLRRVQYRKQIIRLQQFMEEISGLAPDLGPLEEVRHQIQALHIQSWGPSPGGSPGGPGQQATESAWPDSGRARKRTRLSSEGGAVSSNGTFRRNIYRELTAALTGQAVSDLDGLDRIAAGHFQRLAEDDQCHALVLLGYAACQIGADYLSDQTCALCDTDDDMAEVLAKNEALEQDGHEELFKTLLVLVAIIPRSSRARVVAMSSLRRLILHSRSADHLKLSQTPVGEWCLQSLRSSSRDLRTTAGRTMQAYVVQRRHVDTSLIRENRVIALDFLQSLWQKGEVAFQETAVVALARMARVVGDEERNIILLRLAEYLGHTNPYISGIVYAEIQQLAQSLQVTVAALLRPFWRTLGVAVAKNLSSRPIVAHQLCELLGMQIDGLMLMIEEHALPFLVLQKDAETIRRFAAAHGPSTTVFDMCTQRKNLIAILSYLLVQQVADPEYSIIALLSDLSKDFETTDLASWVGQEPIQITCELLKAIGDAGQGKSARIYQALQLVANLLTRRSGPPSASRRADSIGTFLENNVLAIMTHFMALLNDLEVKEPKVEKKRCLAAIGEVVKLGKSRVVSALPQICACLRSGLDDVELCNVAFSSWALMITSLKEEDVEPLIDQTLAIIVKNWDVFDTPTQHQAYNLVSDLLKKHAALVREIFNKMPSLSSIPLMSKFEAEIGNLKRQMDERHQVMAFIDRLKNENIAVVEQALHELTDLLRVKQDLLHRSILREQPDTFVADLARALLDCCVQFNSNTEVLRLSGQCLGSIGCLDSSKLETVRDRKSIVVLSNFGKGDEVVEFVFFFLENVLVKAFLSATTTRAQGFLGWAMQEFLKAVEQDTPSKSRNGLNTASRKWQELPESTKTILTPFLSSKYTVQEIRPPAKCHYPLFKRGMRHRDWLRTMTLDFLHRGPGNNIRLIFDICCRIVNGQDTSIPAFLLPYAALNLVVSGVESDSKDILEEIIGILREPIGGQDRKVQDDIRLCSQTVFEILDYLSTWLQQKRKQYSSFKSRSDRAVDPLLEDHMEQIRSVERLLERIPPDVLAQRAIDCKSYSRALFHWEQFIRQSKDAHAENDLHRLQEIYAQIDEPDGIEGISSRMHVLDIDQQVLEHRKAGRWTAAQSWYEMQLVLHPQDVDVQKNLMECLKESGQHVVLLHHFDGMASQGNTHHLSPLISSYALEAAWVSSRWDRLASCLRQGGNGEDFSSHLARIMLAIHDGQQSTALELIHELYRSVTAELTPSAITSLQSSHDTLLKLHVLDDVRLIHSCGTEDRMDTLATLSRRLDVLGSNVTDKQYLLGIRRAIMNLRDDVFSDTDVAGAWLSSARLARKARSSTQAFNAILKASALGDKSAAIEQAKLMWQEGHHRKAIQVLEGAIESGAFVAHNYIAEEGPVTLTTEQQNYQNEVTAKAYVLLGKWLDQAGQTQSEVIIKTFRKSTENYRKWEKGWYHLGRHYNKILDSEKSMPPGKESQAFLTGEAAKVVIENYLRSLLHATKYVFQTLPKVLTLWLELVDGADQPQDPRRGNEKFHTHNSAQRKRVIEDTNNYIKKYVERIQPVLLYTILPQVVARICHSHPTVYNILVGIVVKIVRAFPQQALWTLLAVIKSQSKDRASRGLTIVSKVVEAQKKSARDLSASDLRNMITAGQRFSDEVLRVSEFPIEGKVSRVSLARDLGFNHKIAPSKLVVPSETCLIPSIPTSYEPAQIKAFRPFAREPITISAFLDEALVLASLQKPRKLSIRGSDGNVYGVLAKPKDDMRKDQRLMEFNTMINRFLKRDVDASKRRLYIRTYAVIPLNEECGLIEWVNNLKTFRDIILQLYKGKNISPNYTEIRNLLDEACSGPPGKVQIFSNKILKSFPPVFYEWFVESFPDPSAWFNARLRYTRSCAVMSIVGHVLGLGDRHGENILFEEDNGGTLHVDFNCLFDKGLTFEKPEYVPFRLTHNMVDAFGAYGYEGPFRRCCEITLTLLRGNQDTLMTILETFLHDPTTDFINAGKRKKQVAGVPNTPVEVLDGVRGKVRGMLPGESVPLSVGGYVEEMIRRATDDANLCRMYIGWCAFF